MIRFGQRLQEERIKQGYSLEDIAKATKIRVEFLRSIEDGNYKSLPPITYVQGFVKNYIDYLGLPEKPLIALFRREFDEKEYIRVLPDNISARREISLNRVRIRQVSFLVCVALLGLFLYIFIQYRSALFNPNLTVSSPLEHAMLSSQTVSIVGNTESDASVTINSIPVIVDNSGNFRKELTVFSGSNTITIKSTNTFGKTTTILRHITVKSSS